MIAHIPSLNPVTNVVLLLMLTSLFHEPKSQVYILESYVLCRYKVLNKTKNRSDFVLERYRIARFNLGKPFCLIF